MCVCLVFCLLNSTEITEQNHAFVVAVPAHLCSAYKYQNICLINYLYITESQNNEVGRDF